MKRKLLMILLAIMSVIICAFGLTACGTKNGDNSSSVSGTYYLYENGGYDKSQYITLNSGKWSDDDNASGTYTIDGTSIIFFAEVFGSNEEMYSGTLSNGVIKIKVFGATYTYCKEGSEPTDENTSSNNTNTKYTITYNANGGIFTDGSVIYTQTVNEGVTLTAPTSPTRTASAFGGWATDKNGKTLWKFASDTVTGDLTLYAVWEEQSAAIISADGATIDETTMSVFMLVDKNIDSVSLSNKIVCSSDSVWRLYYDKLGQTEIPTKIAAGKFGELSNGNNIFYIVVTSSSGAQVNVYELTIHRSYAATVSYYDNKNNLIETDTAYTGYEYDVNYTPNIDGYTFNCWKDESGKTITETTPYSSISLYANCTVKTYTATLNVNGGNDLTKTEYTVTYDNNYIFATPTRTGYSFVGWYDGSTQVTTEKGVSLLDWTYTQNKSFSAKWQANTYSVTLNRNDSSAGTVSGDGDYNYDSNVTISATTNSGYNFLGWYDENNILVSENARYTYKMGFSVTYTAKWDYYTVTTSSNNISAGSVTSYDDTKVSVGKSVTVTATTNIGYSFLGWFNGEEKITENLTYTFTMIKANVTYTAKWSDAVSVELSNFNFTSTPTTCQITSIKDNTVTEIVVPDYVTSISAGALSGCSNLISITIPFVGASKKAANSTYQYPFGYIFGTSSYTGGTSTRQYYYGNSTSNTTNTYYYIPSSLEKVTVTGGNLLYGAFYNCSGLNSITIGENVTSIQNYAFYCCTSLTEINFNSMSCSNLSTENRVFYNAGKGGEGITLKIGSSVTKIPANLFYNYSSSYYAANVKNLIFEENSICQNIGTHAFMYCDGLTSVTIPNSVILIGEGAFQGCNGLISMSIPFIGKNATATSCSYDTVFGYIFGYTTANDSVVTETNGLYAGKTVVKRADVASGATRQYKVQYRTTTVTAYSGTQTLYTNYDYFIPSSLKSIEITGGNILDYSFYGCSSIVDIKVPENLSSFAAYSFYGCAGLTKLPEGGKPTYIGEQAFAYCSGFEALEIPEGITEINYEAFIYCGNLIDVYIPASLSQYRMRAFGYCTKLKNIYITDLAAFCKIKTHPNDFNSLINGHNLYLNGNIVENLVFPEYVTEINEDAFAGCISIKSIYINIETISMYAFDGCKNLENLILGSKVKNIKSFAFSGCSNLLKIYYEGTEEEWNEISVSISGNSNEYFPKAIKYFYSESEPSLNTEGTAYDGNYWYYASDGKTIVEWILTE